MPNNYILTSAGGFVSEDELYHYGVLGMKLGIRKGNVTGSYDKASKKLTKLDNRVQKAKNKAIKTSSAAERASTSWLLTRKAKEKTYRKADRAVSVSQRRTRKAQKWVDQMTKAFANTDQKLSNEQISKGQQYTEELLNIATINSMGHRRY